MTTEIKSTHDVTKRSQTTYTKLNNAEKNPCIRESQLSLKCLDDNDYDKEKCGLAFTNYKNCLKFWARVRSDRKRKGLEPLLPAAADRAAVKEEYVNRWSSGHS